MNEFISKVHKHAEHIKNVAEHCKTEETTKQALILPLLDILGFNAYDPTKVQAEYRAEYRGVKQTDRIDYALMLKGTPVLFIEAKPYGEMLINHEGQLERYFNSATNVLIAAITNGVEWRFFTDLNEKNTMDAEPFLVVDFEKLDESQISRLYNFRHDDFKPDQIKEIAEESVYLNQFTDVIRNNLRDPGADFVRFVAGQANIQRQFNARFIESITPIVKRSVGLAISDMVVTGLSAKPEPEKPKESPTVVDEFADQVDPDNPKIVTTYKERQMYEITKSLLPEAADSLVARDTESYYTVLYDGKTNRWLFRYNGDRREPIITLPIDITDERRREIERAGLEVGAGNTVKIMQPEHLMRIPGILRDSLQYVTDDENFRLKRSE
ncbi:type I restriction endonuclease [Oxalobacter vibrioformis]|uniref:Type I restriction endonuclease n=1 Tax=Oxalobacter vibrioformis TaxID=933080 RepID=A0A9E9LXK2_9BURK|nr:type I restriction endonuclease [Oxalobacter vibrioformis]WAW09279.1 type I restriction endonuclease [Oxalobacter vibrioformis]